MASRLGQAGRALRMLGLYRNWPTAYRNRLARGPRDGEVVYRLRGGLRLALDAGQADVRVVNEVWLDRVYEPTPEFRLREGWTVVDVGAHKGSFTLLAAARGAAQVHAVEPSPANLPILRRNVELNGLRAVRVHSVAVAAARGTATLSFDRGETHQGTLVLERGYATGQAVETITLDDLLAEIDGPVDLLKMDIEGAEVEALRAVSPESLAQVARLVVECHTFADRSGREVADELAALLEGHGFVCTHVRERQLLCAARPEAAA